MSTVVDDDQAKANIAQNVYRILEERGMTQRALAKATGDTPMRISYYVRGEKLASAAALSRIAEALSVTIDSLVSPAPKKSRKRIAS